MIATRLHVLADMCPAEPLVADLGRAPHYVLSDEIVAVMSRDDVQKSILAMLEAGIAHLPFAPMVMEFEIVAGARRFMLLDEAEGGFSARCATLWRNRLADLSPSLIRLRLGADGLIVNHHSDEQEGRAAAFAVSAGLLMLNIRGVEKRVIEAGKLNRARKAHGRPLIPRHQLVRISTIYDRAGVGHRGESHRRMPVHLRAGHTRMQACGPERSERKPVFIPPVLVNYREDGETARLPRKAVRL